MLSCENSLFVYTCCFHLECIILQFYSGTKHLELARLHKLKGSVPNKTIVFVCYWKTNHQATHTLLLVAATSQSSGRYLHLLTILELPWAWVSRVPEFLLTFSFKACLNYCSNGWIQSPEPLPFPEFGLVESPLVTD